MKLLIVFPNNKNYEVEVDREDKVKTLKIKICDKSGCPPYMQTLKYSGKQLNDENTFSQQGVIGGTTIYVTITQTIGDLIELTVQSKIDDSKTYIRIEEGKKIKDLQQKIFDEFKCRPEEQLLYAINGREPGKKIFLHEDRGIWEYEFDHHYVIYFDFEDAVWFQHRRTGERYKMIIKSNSLITQIKDQLRNEHNLSVKEIYVRLDDQSTIAATRVTPPDVLFIELLDDSRKDNNSANFPPEDDPRTQPYQQQPKYHQQSSQPQHYNYPNYPPNYPQHNQSPQQQQQWDSNQQRMYTGYEPRREYQIRPQIDPNVPPQARYSDNYQRNPMEPNFPPPRAQHEGFPTQYASPDQYSPYRHPQPERVEVPTSLVAHNNVEGQEGHS